MQPIQPTFCGRVSPADSIPDLVPAAHPSLCRRDRAIRGFRLTCRPKHRGAPQHPSKLFKLRDMLRGPALPPAPRLSLHLSTRFRLYGSLAILPTYPTPPCSRNNSSRIRVEPRLCWWLHFFFFSSLKKIDNSASKRGKEKSRDFFYRNIFRERDESSFFLSNIREKGDQDVSASECHVFPDV